MMMMNFFPGLVAVSMWFFWTDWALQNFQGEFLIGGIKYTG